MSSTPMVCWVKCDTTCRVIPSISSSWKSMPVALNALLMALVILAAEKFSCFPSRLMIRISVRFIFL